MISVLRRTRGKNTMASLVAAINKTTMNMMTNMIAMNPVDKCPSTKGVYVIVDNFSMKAEIR